MDPANAAGTADWYRTPAGRRAAVLLGSALRPWLPAAATARLLAFEAAAILDSGAPPAALVTASAAAWPGGTSVALAADPGKLPFNEAVFDTALVLHTLEQAASAERFLRELWRVLAPASDLLLIVPNCIGLWSLSDANPFGHGRPYSRRALTATLDAAMFEVVAWRMALAAPPVARLAWAEGAFAQVLPALGGVHVVRARKRDGLAPIAASRAAAPVAVPRAAGSEQISAAAAARKSPVPPAG